MRNKSQRKMREKSKNCSSVGKTFMKNSADYEKIVKH